MDEGPSTRQTGGSGRSLLAVGTLKSGREDRKKASKSKKIRSALKKMKKARKRKK